MIDLKERREAAGITQERLSQESGVKRSTIAMIENGTNTPSVTNAKKLANVLGFNWFEFYEDGGEEDAADGQGSSVTLAR